MKHHSIVSTVKVDNAMHFGNDHSPSFPPLYIWRKSVRCIHTMSVVKQASGMITFQIQIYEARTGWRRLSFTTEKSLPLRMVFLDFCDKINCVYGSVTFLFDGVRLNEYKTAEEAGIEDGDIVAACYRLHGGITLSS